MPKKLSQKEIIRLHLKARPNQWFITHELTQKNLDNGWVGTAGMKRAFELWQDGWLDKDDVPNSNEVMYKYKSKYKTIQAVETYTDEAGNRKARLVDKLIEI